MTVITTARLHFGFLDPSGRGPQPFGSFGLSLDRPRTKLTLSQHDELAVSGPESERGERYLREIAERHHSEGRFALDIAEAIPPHAGLGSGTQLALAIGSAFAAVEGIRFSPQEIAAQLGRGARSGIGIATFEQGGAVLDGGPCGGALPQLVARVPFPAEWRVLLIFHPGATGLAGASEVAAFESLSDFPESETAELRRRITEIAMPALTKHDFASFCGEVGQLQDCMGAYFAPLQGGAYASPLVSDVLDRLRAEGITGLGQSSWGPTGFAFASSQAEGEALLARAKARAGAIGLEFALARGRNEGAQVETGSSASAKA